MAGSRGSSQWDSWGLLSKLRVERGGTPSVILNQTPDGTCNSASEQKCLLRPIKCSNSSFQAPHQEKKKKKLISFRSLLLLEKRRLVFVQLFLMTRVTKKDFCH